MVAKPIRCRASWLARRIAAMSELKRERMSSVDNAWLRMDRPSNLMMICGVLVFRNSVDLRRLKRTIRDRFLRFTRLCQRPVQVDGATWWEGSPAIDMNYHLQRLLLPAPAGKRELQMAVSALVSEPLSPAHPLWQFHLVESYRGGSALVLRIHHCYADGIALI